MSAHPEADPFAAEFRQRQADDISPLWILAVLVRERRAVIATVLLGVLVAAVVTVVRKPTYTTSFSFIPQSGQDAGRSGLATLAGQVGLSLGAMGAQGQSPQFYADLLETREILEPIAADTFSVAAAGRARPLSELFGISASGAPERVDGTIRRLREKVVKSSVAARTTGVVTVAVKTESPQLSQEISERLLRELDRFNIVTRRTQAAAERRFVEGRLGTARVSLRTAEDALQGFLQQNRVVSAPELVFRQGRLQSDLELQRQLVTGLVQQYEEARIREVRDTPVITVIERPRLAVRPDPRKRLITLAAGFFTAFLVAVSYVLVKDAVQRRRGDPDPAVALLAAEWRRLRRTPS